MRKRKERLIIFILVIGMITIGMAKIGEVTIAVNEETVRKKNSDVSVVSDKIPTPEEYFEVGYLNEYDKSAELTAFKKDKAEAQGITEVIIPNKIGEYTVNSIGNYSFLGCVFLTSVEIPSSATGIYGNAFQGCSNLKSIKIPDSVTNIGSDAFSSCTSLKSIVIPNAVTKIDHRAFEGCTSLKSIAIPNTITDIGAYVFNNCPIEELVTVCQDSNNMDIPADSPINGIPKADTNVYRIAVTHYDIQADENEIKAYEYMGRTVSPDNIFNLHMDTVVRKGMTGDEDNGSSDINAEDYLDKSITYTLQGSSENGETSLEGHELYIGKNETSNELKIEAVKGDVTKTLPIRIVQAESISIKEAPKSIYDEGQEYKPEDLVITILYEDHRQEDIKYEENKDDFSFTVNGQLTFETKEQVIRYKDTLEVKHPLTIYGTTTLRESNVGVTGMFSNHSELKIGRVKEDAKIYEGLSDKKIIADYDIEIEGDYTRSNELQIEFELGNELDGKKVNIRHQKGNGDREEFEGIVNEGKVRVEVTELSPFIIYTEKVVEEPETPIIPKPNVPDESKPVIKPTPDTSVQTKPNQPQKDIVLTEDNNHLLLWGVLGIMSMGAFIVMKTLKVDHDK